MRPSLSSLVRAVLLEANKTASDEAVIVHPSHMSDKRDAPEPSGAPSWLVSQSTDEEEEALYRHYEKEAKQAHAYVSTDRWRSAVVRTYTFLDEHTSVNDVVVMPVACHNYTIPKIFGRRRAGDMNRAKVMSRDEASQALTLVGANLPDASDQSIVFIPFVGGGALVDPTPGTLPSAWMTVHSLFDDDKTSLTACEEVMRSLTTVLTKYANDVTAVPLLFNCGWSENAYKVAMAAYKREKNKKGGEENRMMNVYHRLGSDFGEPAVGKKYKSVEDVSVVPGKGDRMGIYYVERPVTDLVAEAMTIAATKPAGFQPDLDRLKALPDVFVKSSIQEEDFPDIYEKRWSDEPLTPQERSRVEESIKMDLEEISMMTHDVRERLVHDLLGKVVLVAVH
jgi:hypothetical protein